MPTVPLQGPIDDGVELMRALIRVDTTNPPGNEKPAALLLADWLRSRGLEPVIIEPAPSRASVVCRIRGTGERGPVLLHSHLDVVAAEAEHWTHPPFGGDLADGYVWGRGALDIKNFVAMSAVMLDLVRKEGRPPRRDVILAATADEEVGGKFGAAHIVDHHPELVSAEYGLGELGGIPMQVASRSFFLVGVAEKGWSRVRMRATGRPGHGAVTRDESAIVRLAEAVARIGSARLPHHLTPVVDRFLSLIERALPFPKRLYVPLMRIPRIADWLIRHEIPRREQAHAFAAMLSNTATPTVFQAGSKINVVPSEAVAELDCRTLPGQTGDDLLRELAALGGPDVQVGLVESSAPVQSPLDGPVMAAITKSLSIHQPDAIPIPYLNPGSTDGRFFVRLGTLCYGFTPVRFDGHDRVELNRLIHGHDERIPVAGFGWGVAVLWDVVRELLYGDP